MEFGVGGASALFQPFTAVSYQKAGGEKSKNNPDNYHLEHLICPLVK